MSRAWLGLGGNIGDVRQSMATALQGLNELKNTQVLSVSPVYKTPPWGVEDQPWFLNCCAGIDTNASPEELLEQCQEAERAGHRERVVRWGPRTIDIDILVYEGIEQIEQRLVLPHPRIAERAFVLVPLAEIAPDLLLGGETIKSLATAIDAAGVELETKSIDWWR